MTIAVRIVQLGRGVAQYTGDDGVDVATSLAEAGMSVQGMEVRVNGITVTLDQILCDGDLVTVVPRIKGGCRLERTRRSKGSLRQGRAIRQGQQTRDSVCGT